MCWTVVLSFISNSKTYRDMNTKFTLFCVKVVVFVVLLFAIDRVVGAAFVSMKDMGLKKNPENMWLKTPFVVEKVNSDVVIIGSSKASHHYVPQMLEDSLGMTAYNCGQDGCFFLYQNCVINMLLDRYKPKMIIWDIQPGSFTSHNEKEYQNIRYLSPYYPQSVWAKRYIDSESKKMPLRMQSRMFAYNSKALNYLFPLVMGSSKTENGYIPLPNEGYQYPEKRKREEVEIQYSPNEKYLSLLSATLERCKEEGVIVQLFISPEYNDESDAYLAAVKDISRVSFDKGVHCHNYHSLAANDSTMFKDASHLNDKGARRYTAKVVQDICVR